MGIDIKKKVSFCPHCGHDSPQILLKVCCVRTSRSDGDFHTFARCETCLKPLVYLSQLRIGDKQRRLGAFYYDLDKRQLVYPEPETLHRAIPAKIGRFFMEAQRIKTISANSFAASVRRCLEMVCNDRGARDDTLVKQLAELESKGEIPQPLANMTDVIRLLGNSASHDDVEIDTGFVDTIDDFFRAILDFVYVRPFQISEIKKKFDNAKNAKRTAAGKVS